MYDYEAVRRLRTCTSFIAVCKSIRAELAPLLFPKLKITFWSWAAAERFNHILTDGTRSMITDLSFGNQPRRKTDVELRTAWLEVLSGYFNLRIMKVGCIWRGGRVADKGTEFSEKTLRWLKAIMTDHTNLVKAYHRQHSRGSVYSDVYIQSPNVAVHPDVSSLPCSRAYSLTISP